jgi:cytochrome c oxidase subunit 4
MRMYWGVFGALLVLTVVTVAISELGLPMPISIILALAVAFLKAGLVSAIFMHLYSEERAYTMILVMSLFFCAVFFGLTLLDVLTRGSVAPENGIHVVEDEIRKSGKVPRGFRVAKEGADAHGGHGGEHGKSEAPAAHDASHEAAPAAH